MENWYRSSLANSFMSTKEWASQPEGMKSKSLQVQARESTDFRQQQATLQNLEKVPPTPIQNGVGSSATRGWLYTP